MPVYGLVEAGGTKFVVGIAASPEDIRKTARFDTISPDETIGAVVEWLKAAQSRNGALASIGIASFGPVQLNRDAANWDI